MKKNKLVSLLMAGVAFGFVACNNSSDTAATDADSVNTASTGDTSSMTNTANNANTSTNDYSAFADTVEKNSQAGYYVNARTGKKQRLKVDRTTGGVTDEQTGEPVWRYVDTRNWWVYGLDDKDWMWDTVGHAKMDNNKIMYEGDNGTWSNYDAQWKASDENLKKTWKTRIGDTKIKVDKSGDVKVKDKTGTVKYEADDNKVKSDSSHK
jgi:hypothetical protein